MKQKELSIWVKAIVILGFVCVLFLDAVYVPAIGREIAAAEEELSQLFWPCLIYFWLSTVPVMVFMVLIWRIAVEIGRDNSFCLENAQRLKLCCFLAAGDTVYYLLGGVVLTASGLMTVSLLILGFGVCAIGAAISVICAVASHLTQKAAFIRSENDLTI